MTLPPQRCNKTDCWAYKEGFCYAKCASHSNPQAERDVKELFRNMIAKWKDEDPLFMAYVYGQEAGKKEELEKVLEVPLKSLKSVIGLAFSFSQLPEEVRNQLIEVDNFYHKAKELRQSKEGEP